MRFGPDYDFPQLSVWEARILNEVAGVERSSAEIRRRLEDTTADPNFVNTYLWRLEDAGLIEHTGDEETQNKVETRLGRRMTRARPSPVYRLTPEGEASIKAHVAAVTIFEDSLPSAKREMFRLRFDRGNGRTRQPAKASRRARN